LHSQVVTLVTRSPASGSLTLGKKEAKSTEPGGMPQILRAKEASSCDRKEAAPQSRTALVPFEPIAVEVSGEAATPANQALA
jgi:hypothetical protein